MYAGLSGVPGTWECRCAPRILAVLCEQETKVTELKKKALSPCEVQQSADVNTWSLSDFTLQNQLLPAGLFPGHSPTAGLAGGT